MQRLAGRDVSLTLSRTGRIVLFDQVNLNLSSGISAVTSGGYPAGWVYGEITGDGDILIDPEALDKLLVEASAAGSWEEMVEEDMTLFSKVAGKTRKIEVFGVKMDFPDEKVDRKGGDKITHTVKFLITGEDFVHMDGVPLARRQS